MAPFITKKVFSKVCCPVYLLSHPHSPQTLLYQFQGKQLHNNWNELIFRAFLFWFVGVVWLVCLFVWGGRFVCFFVLVFFLIYYAASSLLMILGCFRVSSPLLQVGRCAEALALSPWREGWQCPQSGLCGAHGAVYGPKLGIAVEAAEAVSSEISADFHDVGRALSCVVRKGICSIKTLSASRLML